MIHEEMQMTFTCAKIRVKNLTEFFCNDDGNRKGNAIPGVFTVMTQ